MKPTITVMRHGTAQYEQNKVSLGDAQDLTPDGAEEVASAAQKLAATIPLSSTVRMWSSPFSRTLQTAKIVCEVLEAHNHTFSLKNADAEAIPENIIRSFHRFDEVRNFNLKLFLQFLNGGEVSGFGNGLVILDKTITNPDGLSFAEYFNERAWELVTNVPQALLDSMHRIEQCVDTRLRLSETLYCLGSLSLQQETHIVLVTHLGLMEGVVAETVKPSDFVTVQL